MIDTAIVIANWNGARHLPGCLGALEGQSYRRFGVWVLDNGSSDGSVAMLREAGERWPGLPEVHLLEERENTGFARGNNIAIEDALRREEIEYVVTLNNDTVAERDWLKLMVGSARREWRTGSVAATMVFAAQPDLVAGAGIGVGRDGLALDLRVGEPVAGLPAAPEPVFGASAGAALYRRDMLIDTGLFDEHYFSYLEDADLAWRARLYGWRSVWVPRAIVRHEVSATGVHNSPFKNYHLARNRIWTIVKNMPGALLARLWPYVLRYDALAVGYSLLRRDLSIARGRMDALLELPRVLRQRREVQGNSRVGAEQFAQWLAPAQSPLGALRLRRAVGRVTGNGL